MRLACSDAVPFSLETVPAMRGGHAAVVVEGGIANMIRSVCFPDYACSGDDKRSPVEIPCSTGLLLIIGGADPDGIPSNDVFAFDLDTHFWARIPTRGPDVLPPRSGHSAHVWRCGHEQNSNACDSVDEDTSIIVFGGLSVSGDMYSDLWELRLSS